MKITKTYCNHCGKELLKDNFVDVSLISYNLPVLSNDYDLCNECAQTLVTLFRINEGEEKSNV